MDAKSLIDDETGGITFHDREELMEALQVFYELKFTFRMEGLARQFIRTYVHRHREDTSPAQLI